jgi:hypothetical protein
MAKDLFEYVQWSCQFAKVDIYLLTDIDNQHGKVTPRNQNVG